MTYKILVYLKLIIVKLENEDDLDISATNKESRLFIAFYLNKIRIIDNFVLY